ncbi:hypothetical protein [Helicobacter pylori]|uniref:hypothetical protein n=1 Tax=Helicobacter pylori TaxID=210 RepID=UPI0013EF6CAC|nr:hypothetical protein [Helicobacter pylori]
MNNGVLNNKTNTLKIEMMEANIIKKKMILQEMRIKKGLKTIKTQVKANRLKNRLKTLFSVFCFRFINLFRLRPH